MCCVILKNSNFLVQTMENNLMNQFTFNFKEILVDEIALEGLEGIGFDLLWRRIEKRISSPITEKMKARFWRFLVYCDTITMYENPEPLGYVEIKDRFELIDEETGNIYDPPEYLDGPYEYEPISNDFGSSIYYQTREKLPKEMLKNVPYEKVLELYGDKFIIVADLAERWKALAPHMPFSSLKELTRTHYCLLELIGKARDNGQMTVGNTNLTKIIKDSKLMFYNRKFLQGIDLIRVQSVPQVTGNRSVRCLLLRLKRFHQPLLMSMPKKGKIYEIAQYLMTQPNYTDVCKNIIDMKLVSPGLCKKLCKWENTFVFDTIEVPPKKKIKQMSNKCIRLDPPSEDSSQSDEETAEEFKCKYQIKVNLQRQAYERILEAGLDGLTQVQLAELIGVEYYTARTICRTFKTKNIVKEIFVEKGKQRIARFVASAAAAVVGAKYEEEKKKFLEYDNENKIAVAAKKISELPDAKHSDSDSEIPKKKAKTHNTIEDLIPDTKTIEKIVTEIKHLDGFENIEHQPFINSRKVPTMRQLRYANGILKTIQDKILVSGYMNLSSLAAKESNEPLMDSKCLKIIVQKLVAGGQIKLLKMTWPMWHKSCIVFCAPHVQVSDAMVKTKYKEISLTMLRNRRVVKEKEKKTTKEPETMTRPIAMSIYPRYLKLQKLHEFLIKLVYFNDDASYQTIAPEGFSSLVDIIPEFTVEFVLGCMSSIALMAMYDVQIPKSMMQQKLRSVPGDLFKTFLATPTLQNGWRLNLKVLSALGLIQLIKNPTLNDDNYVLSYEFYVNRHASIIDTTGDWPRDDVDKQALQKKYYFETFADVERYWKDVFDISQNTTITLDSNARSNRQPLYVPRLREEVSFNDNGQFYGNGLGPCGFDASFYMDMPKLWVMSHTRMKHHAMLKKPVINMPKRKKPGKPKKPKKTIKRKRVFKAPTQPSDPKKKRKRVRPPMTSTPKWCRDEDRIIMLCKAAVTVFSPMAQIGCLRLRNIVAKDILSLFDPKKTAAACHKRATMLEPNTTLAYEKDCVINELKRYPAILRKYEGLFKTLRLQYCGNISKVLVAARLPMLELVYVMFQLLKNETFNKKVPCVAINLEDFRKNYTICPSTVNRNYNSYKTPLEAGPVLAAIKEGIIVAVMTTYRVTQTPETGRKIHSMFSVYPEQTLRPAIEQLRKAGAVAARDKTMNNAIHKFHFQDIAQSSYKLSSNYMRQWICRMNAEFADNLMFSLDDEMPSSDLKGNSELNCLLFESQSSDVLDIFCTSVPIITRSGGTLIQEEQMTVTEMMMSFKIKPGAVGCKYKKNINKFSELFQDVEYEKALEILLRQSQLHKPLETVAEDDVLSYLKKQIKSGTTFEKLQKATGYTRETLTACLKTLESKIIVKRLGYYENLIVLTEFAKPWTITIKDKKVVPTPWLTLDLDFRNDVFLKWAGAIVNKVFVKPGCSIAYIADECEFLSTRSAQDICTVLEKCGCVTLKCIYVSEPDLFSEDTMPVFEDFNPYASVENILVFPKKDMLTRYSYVRKRMFDDQYYFEKT